MAQSRDPFHPPARHDPADPVGRPSGHPDGRKPGRPLRGAEDQPDPAAVVLVHALQEEADLHVRDGHGAVLPEPDPGPQREAGRTGGQCRAVTFQVPELGIWGWRFCQYVKVIRLLQGQNHFKSNYLLQNDLRPVKFTV